MKLSVDICEHKSSNELLGLYRLWVIMNVVFRLLGHADTDSVKLGKLQQTLCNQLTWSNIIIHLFYMFLTSCTSEPAAKQSWVWKPQQRFWQFLFNGCLYYMWISAALTSKVIIVGYILCVIIKQIRLVNMFLCADMVMFNYKHTMWFVSDLILIFTYEYRCVFFYLMT